jgi:hypothetical protein
MCVRNAVLSAWTTLEMAYCDALEIEKLENFKASLHAEFDKRKISRLNFGSGLWQEINTTIKDHRKRFIHSGVKISDRFPSVSIAEYAISTIREAVHEIYAAVGKQAPRWIDNDQSGGWQERRIGFGMFGHLTVSNAGARPETPGGHLSRHRCRFPYRRPFQRLLRRLFQVPPSAPVPARLLRPLRTPTVAGITTTAAIPHSNTPDHYAGPSRFLFCFCGFCVSV